MNDLLLNKTSGDLAIKNGDFTTGDSEEQDILLLLQSSPGDWSEFPVIGADLAKFINSPKTDLVISSMLSQVQKQLEIIGINKQVSINETNELVIS